VGKEACLAREGLCAEFCFCSGNFVFAANCLIVLKDLTKSENPSSI
jgi:hypothetical protein